MAVEGGSDQGRNTTQQIKDTVEALVRLREEVPEAEGPVTRTLNVLTDAFTGGQEKPKKDSESKPKI